jgi:two component, sigma54 specific, transcriptional regulator, Fis family
LLRVIQERQVRPVGAAQAVDVNVRIISATHRDLKASVTAGEFREDLYYRLNVVALNIPPLAERREDIALLANHFLRHLAQKYTKKVNGFAPEAMALLVGASWPGNVRQLMNVVEQCVVLCTGALVSMTLVQDAMHKEDVEMVSFEEARKRFERTIWCAC